RQAARRDREDAELRLRRRSLDARAALRDQPRRPRAVAEARAGGEHRARLRDFTKSGSEPYFAMDQATRSLSRWRSALGTRRFRSRTSMPTTCFFALKSRMIPRFTSSQSTILELSSRT